MTLEQKLKHFETVCTEDAKRQYDQLISDYTEQLNADFLSHKEDVRKQAENNLRAETERIRREMNYSLSANQISIRRAFAKKQEELRGKVFSELRDRLARFMETAEYEHLLEEQIRKAKEFADGNEIHIYIDPADQTKKQLLSLNTDCDIRISRYSFLGGTRAVIASRNILIDNSFETKLNEAEKSFQFVLGGE